MMDGGATDAIIKLCPADASCQQDLGKGLVVFMLFSLIGDAGDATAMILFAPEM